MSDNADFPIVFDFEDSPIRTVDRQGEAWFVAADICRALEIGNVSDVIRSLDEDESTLDTIEGSHRPTNLINEFGLYSLILKSRKPEAKRFKRWITHEVLPSIRKTGSYSKPQNVPRLSTLTRNSLTLLQALRKETNPDARRYLHDQLTIVSRMLGVQPPPISAIGSDAPEVPSMVDDFWGVYEALTTGKDSQHLNHSAKPDTIAISLVEVCKVAKQRGLDLPPRMQLAHALRQSRDPQFLGASRSVRSTKGHLVRCWVFEGVPLTQT
jgi:prophage antirepressor-like protein